MDYYGALTPLRQLAGISVPDSSMLVVQPYDTGAMDEIERAILESDLGINPTNDGKILRLNIPQLTAVSHVTPCVPPQGTRPCWPPRRSFCVVPGSIEHCSACVRAV